MDTTHQGYKRYESGTYHYVMCYEVREMKKHTVFLSGARREERSVFFFFHLSSSNYLTIYYAISNYYAYLTIQISLHSFKYSSKIGEIFNFIDNYSDLQIPHLKKLW